MCVRVCARITVLSVRCCWSRSVRFAVNTDFSTRKSGFLTREDAHTCLCESVNVQEERWLNGRAVDAIQIVHPESNPSSNTPEPGVGSMDSEEGSAPRVDGTA